MCCKTYYMFLIFIYLYTCNLPQSNGDIRLWKHSTLYNNTNNWENGKIPCAVSRVIFPTDLDPVISFLPDTNKMSELILPRTGVLAFPQHQSSLLFSDYNKKSTKDCDGGDRLFKQLKKEAWLDPNNWISIDYKDNSAIPDMERVPCQYDMIKFPPSAEVSIDIPNIGLSIGGMYVQEKLDSSIQLLSTFKAQNLRQSDDNKCRIKSGCLCHPDKWENDKRLETQICEYAKKHCKQVHCLTPIKPIGQCCNMCGSTLLMKYSSNFSLLEFKNYTKNFLKKYEITNIDFYVSKVWNNQIQLIFRETDEYSTKSIDAVNKIKELIKKDTYLGLSFFSIQVSGQYYNPDAGFSGFKMIFLTLLAALAIIGVAYVATQKTHQYPILPASLRLSLGLNSLPSLNVYSPFRNTGFNIESCWPFTSYTELDSTQNENMEFLQTFTQSDDDDNEPNRDQEFENPLCNEDNNIEDIVDTEVESCDLDNENSEEINKIDPKAVNAGDVDGNKIENLTTDTVLLNIQTEKSGLSNDSLDLVNDDNRGISQDSLMDETLPDEEL